MCVLVFGGLGKGREKERGNHTCVSPTLHFLLWKVWAQQPPQHKAVNGKCYSQVKTGNKSGNVDCLLPLLPYGGRPGIERLFSFFFNSANIIISFCILLSQLLSPHNLSSLKFIKAAAQGSIYTLGTFPLSKWPRYLKHKWLGLLLSPSHNYICCCFFSQHLGHEAGEPDLSQLWVLLLCCTLVTHILL